MVGKTHQIAAAVSLVGVGALVELPHMSLATLTGVIVANSIGGMFPDVDQPTSDIWDRVPLGGVVGRLLSPFAGGHRHITHSLLGLLLFGWLAKLCLDYFSSVVLIDMHLVWWAFIIGYISHLVTDGLTEEGVPLLFPLPLNFGFPPVRRMRIKTGHWFERLIVVPGLILLGTQLVYYHRHHFVAFFHSLS